MDDEINEVYSEDDFQPESNQKLEEQEIEDDYIEDEFEQLTPVPAIVPDKQKNLVAAQQQDQNQITQQPDLGNVAKVAKKEGVFEVVEADDGKEKALSSGGVFSEISVKDESEEENKNDAQILLDD